MIKHALPSKLAEEVAGRLGLSLPASRKDAVNSAIGRAMAQRGLSSSRLFLDRLRRDQDLTDDLVAAITVGETHFFRGAEQFHMIRHAILPELLRRRSGERPLRIWSIGCATGEEPYSLAILCDEEGVLDGVRISAADISRQALAAAAVAEYGEWSLRNTNLRLRRRHFEFRDGRFRLNERLRRRVDFARVNLGVSELPAREKGLGDFDLILCRNVLVYVDAGAIRQIAQQLFACLSDGGWLLTAPTDPPLWKYAPFETSITQAGVTYRRAADSAQTCKSSTTPVPILRRETKNLPAPARNPQPYRPDAKKMPIANSVKAIARQIRERLDQGEPGEAERLAQQAVETHPLSAELHFLHARSHMARGKTDAATVALRRVVYLNSTLPAAQFFLGVCLKDSDELAALRALENALLSCLSRSPRERLVLMPETTVRYLARRVRREISEIHRHAEDGA